MSQYLTVSQYDLNLAGFNDMQNPEKVSCDYDNTTEHEITYEA